MQRHKARLYFNLVKKLLNSRKMTAVINPSNGYLQENTLNGNSTETISFNNVDTFNIHTGNITHWRSLKRRSTQNPQTELQDSLIKTLNSCGNHTTYPEDEKKHKAKRLRCVNEKGIEKVSEEQRPLMKITAKIFAHQIDASQVKEAVDETLNELGTTYFDVIFLALPYLDEESQVTFMDVAKPYWQEMEKLHRDGTALNIATCDLDQPKLKQLVEWAEVKPEVNQVNLTSCCHMPEQLVAYAKENDVLLHTHGDPPVILPDANLEEIIGTLGEVNKSGWHSRWVVRYSVIIKCRGVIKNKGYVASLAHDLTEHNGECSNGFHANGSCSNGNGVDH